MRQRRSFSGGRAVPSPLDDLFAQTHGSQPSDPLDSLYAQTHGARTAGIAPATQPPPPPKEEGFVEKMATLNPGNIIAGQLKGIGSTAYNLYKGVANTIQNQPAETVRSPQIESALEAKNAGQALGKGSEQAAEFMAGEGALAKAATKIPTLAKATVAAPRIARAATAAVSGAGVAKAQGATNEQAATAGAIGAGLPALIEGTAAGMKWLGTKTMASGLGISGKQAAAGASPETLTKYGLAKPTLKGTLEAVHGKIVDLATELRGIVGNAKTATGQTPTVNLVDAVDNAEKALLAHGSQIGMSPDELSQTRVALAKYREMYQSLPNGPVVPLDEAQTVKRAAGLAGAWEHGKPAADRGLERVANSVYGNLKQAIEQGVGTQAPELQAVNKQLGELMPLEQAIVRRIPVEARQAPLALTDWMLIATGHPIEAGARMTLKTFPIGIGAGAVGAASGMRTATRPLTATMQEIAASNNKRSAQPLEEILKGNEPTSTGGPFGNYPQPAKGTGFFGTTDMGTTKKGAKVKLIHDFAGHGGVVVE